LVDGEDQCGVPGIRAAWPLAALFARLRGVQAAPGMTGAFMAGLRLVSWDATMLDVADSEANTAAFITSRNRRGVGAFAKVRLMARGLERREP
jgi:hypothetical protein